MDPSQIRTVVAALTGSADPLRPLSREALYQALRAVIAGSSGGASVS